MLIINGDKFAADTYARLTDRVNIAEIEERLTLLDQTEAEAQKLNFKPRAQWQETCERSAVF